MVTADVGRLQVHEVEEKGDASAICIVRCVGGTPRTGQKFTTEKNPGVIPGSSTVTLESIIRHNKEMDFIDPPHNARVRLSGEVLFLWRGVSSSSPSPRIRFADRG
jgi:hypothetical protein